MQDFYPAVASVSSLHLPTLKPLFARVRFAGEKGTGGNSLSHKKIMVVDDDEDISTILKSGLKRGGFSVDVFTDPLEALACFKPGCYDMLLLDVRMPKMNGFDLCKAARRQDEKFKVCFISAFEIHEGELENLMPEQDRKYIVKKPILMKDLVKRINDILTDNA